MVGKGVPALIKEHLDRAIEAYNKGRFYEAESILYKVIWTMEISPDDHIMARTILGNSLRRMGRTVEAENELNKAMEIAGMGGGRGSKGELLLSQGKLQFRKGDLRLANDLLSEALECYMTVRDNIGMGKALIDLGNTQTLLGNYEEAERLFSDGVNVIRRTADKREEIRALHNLSYVHFHMKDYERARQTLLECMILCNELDEPHFCIHTFSSLAQTDIHLGDLAEADTYIAKAGSLLDRTEDRMCRLNVRWVQGLLMGARGDRKGAISVFNEVKGALEDIKAPAPMIEFLLDYIPILVDGGDVAAAREALERAQGLVESRFMGHYGTRLQEARSEIEKYLEGS